MLAPTAPKNISDQNVYRAIPYSALLELSFQISLNEVDYCNRFTVGKRSWCRWPDSNRHERGSLPPQDSVSTSSTTSAIEDHLFGYCRDISVIFRLCSRRFTCSIVRWRIRSWCFCIWLCSILRRGVLC